MRQLPLYPVTPRGALMEVRAEPRDAGCTRCPLHEKTRTVCMSAEGAPGGLLVVGETPSKIEDQLGRPMSDGVGKFLRSLIARWWQGPIALDNAVRCPAGREIEDASIEQCRPFGRMVFNQTRPKRILAIGNAGVTAVLGRRPPLTSARRGYSFLIDDLDDPIPVFLLTPPAMALRNRFDRAVFEEDLKWALTFDPGEPDWSHHTSLVETRADAEAVLKLAMSWDGGFVYDVETCGRMPNRDFSIESLTVMPLLERPVSYTWTRAALKDQQVCEPLRELLRAQIDSTTQNGKYDDRSVFTYFGIDVPTPAWDTRLIRKLLEPEAAANLDVMGWLVGLGGHKDEAGEKTSRICKELRRLANPPDALTPTGKQRKIKPPEFDVEASHLAQIREGTDAEAFMFHYLDEHTLYRYNARDVLVTRQTARLLAPRLLKHSYLRQTWEKLTLPSSIAVRHMEQWGIGCDRDAVVAFSTYCQGKLSEARKKIELHKPGLNPNSPKQVASYLFDELGLKSTKETASGGRSTDNEVLESLASKHPVVAALVAVRKYTKLDSNYASGMLAHIREDGRVHPSILVDGTDTGRFSCSDPNLQNIPRSEADDHNPDAAMARSCFVSAPGWLLLELDYSQIELRVMAILSGDPVMTADFASGVDIHMNNATLSCEAAFKIPRSTWDKMTKEQRKPYRSKIKSATFAKPYGKKPRTLAKEWGVPVADAEAIDRAIWGRYNVFDRWTKEQIARTRKLGYVETWWDGGPAVRRPIHKIGSDDEYERAHAENQAVNTPVQGTASHFMSASLPKIVDYVISEAVPAKVVLTVHDSVMLEVQEKCLSEVAHECRRIMRSHNSNGVPIDVEAKVGRTWGSMTDFKFTK